MQFKKLLTNTEKQQYFNKEIHIFHIKFPFASRITAIMQFSKAFNHCSSQLLPELPLYLTKYPHNKLLFLFEPITSSTN